jgi:2-dehydropantoate 2-reductase
MGDSRALAQAVRCIRETLKVVEARGVVMKNYRNEILPYKTPAFIAGMMMKRLFAKDKLASRIMTLHNDVQDMLYGCRCVYEEGKRRNLSLPIFYENIENVLSLNKGRNG